MRYHFIVNPGARSGLGMRIWKQIEQELHEEQIDYELHMTERKKHAMQISEEITRGQDRCAEECVLVVLGGDGTINEVINGIADLSKVTLGYIPIGSSNDFSRNLSLSTDYRQALRHILSPKEYYHINIGVMNYTERKRRFAVSGGLGFDAGVCHQVMVSPWKRRLNKLRLGKLSYVVVALQRILTMTPRSMTVCLDDDRKIDFSRVYFAAVMNQRYEGGGFMFCPKADPEDDMLDVIVVDSMSKLKILCLLPTAFKGWHVHVKGIHIYRCRKAKFISPVSLPVHTDGEPVFLKREVNACLEPDRLRVIKS